MAVCVLCVGKLKEKWAREGCEEYLKRLSRFDSVEVREIPDQPEPAHPSEALNQKVMQKARLHPPHRPGGRAVHPWQGI